MADTFQTALLLSAAGFEANVTLQVLGLNVTQTII